MGKILVAAPRSEDMAGQIILACAVLSCDQTDCRNFSRCIHTCTDRDPGPRDLDPNVSVQMEAATGCLAVFCEAYDQWQIAQRQPNSAPRHGSRHCQGARAKEAACGTH